MEEFMKKTKGVTVAFDKLPVILRFIFALPVLDGIVYGIYRILRGHWIAGLLWLIFGMLPGAIIDMVCIMLKGKVTFCA